MTSSSWQDEKNDLGSLLGGAGYTNCYPPPLYEDGDSASNGKWVLMNVASTHIIFVIHNLNYLTFFLLSLLICDRN